MNRSHESEEHDKQESAVVDRKPISLSVRPFPNSLECTQFDVLSFSLLFEEVLQQLNNFSDKIKRCRAQLFCCSSFCAQDVWVPLHFQFSQTKLPFHKPGRDYASVFTCRSVSHSFCVSQCLRDESHGKQQARQLCTAEWQEILGLTQVVWA